MERNMEMKMNIKMKMNMKMKMKTGMDMGADPDTYEDTDTVTDMDVVTDLDMDTGMDTDMDTDMDMDTETWHGHRNFMNSCAIYSTMLPYVFRAFHINFCEYMQIFLNLAKLLLFFEFSLIFTQQTFGKYGLYLLTFRISQKEISEFRGRTTVKQGHW